jgi:hypothetical protein
MENVSTESIEHRYHEVKRPAGVDVADFNMPFLVDFRWLNEACAFFAGGHDTSVLTLCILNNSIRGAWAHGDDVVKHHECQSSVTFEWMFVVEVKNRLLLPFFETPVSGDFTVMAVDLSVAFEPCVVLARGEFCPLEQVFAWQFGTLRPILHLVNNLVSNIVGR